MRKDRRLVEAKAIVRETHKALLVLVEEKRCEWLPKKCIRVYDLEGEPGLVIEMPLWMRHSKRMTKLLPEQLQGTKLVCTHSFGKVLPVATEFIEVPEIITDTEKSYLIELPGTDPTSRWLAKSEVRAWQTERGIVIRLPRWLRSQTGHSPIELVRGRRLVALNARN